MAEGLPADGVVRLRVLDDKVERRAYMPVAIVRAAPVRVGAVRAVDKARDEAAGVGGPVEDLDGGDGGAGQRRRGSGRRRRGS